MLEDMGSVEMQHVIRRHLREENPPPIQQATIFIHFLGFGVDRIQRGERGASVGSESEEKPRATKRTSISPCTFWILE